MLTKEANELLTRVGPGTPAGELLRRYWQPVCPASELTQEKPKKRIEILGEELVVFRLPPNGRPGPRYGCVAEHCSHRGASLYYGFVEDDGIRCAYHGWKYEPTGRCIDQPFEKDRDFKREVCHRAYPVEKLSGLLFAYFGPPDKKPLLPRWDVLVREDGRKTLEVRPVLNCNWLQIMENSVDTVHTHYLHGHSMKLQGLAGAEFYHRPIVDYDWEICEWGIIKRCFYGGEKPQEEVRPPLVFPNMLRIPAGELEAFHWRVPIDDTHTQIFVMFLKPSGDGKAVEQPEDPPVQVIGSLRSADGEYDMTGFAGQDQMAWETQGAICDRTAEHLGATDKGITMYRKMLRDQIESVRRGGEPIALVRNPEKNRIIEFSGTQPILT